MSVFDKTSAAAKKPEPVTYKHTAAVAAHELGHATHFENPIVPGSVRMPLEMLFGLGCTVGGVAAAIYKKPLLAAALGLAGHVPTLVEEYRATKDGLTALEASGKVTPKQLGHAKKELHAALGTYGTAAASAALTMGAFGLEGGKHDLTGKILGLGTAIAGPLAIWGLWKRMDKYDKLGRRLTPAETNELREQMGVNAKIRRGEKNVNYYAPAAKNSVLRWLLRQEIEGSLHESNDTKRDVKNILDHGGVVLEGHHCKMAALRGYNAALALVA